MNSFQYRKFKRSQPSKFFPTSLQTYHFRSLSDECKLNETAIIINCIKKPILWKLLNMFMLLFIKIPIKYGKNWNIYSIILLRRNNILLAYIQLHSSVYGRYLNSSKNQYNTSVYITVVHVGIILFQMLLNILAQVTHISNIVCAEELNTEGLLQ